MLVTEMDLPELDLNDPSLKGERWHAEMNGLLDDGHWLAAAHREGRLRRGAEEEARAGRHLREG